MNLVAEQETDTMTHLSRRSRLGRLAARIVRTTAFAPAAMLCLGLGTPHAALLGPSPYLDVSDSPFDGILFDSFFLEDFKDGLFNTGGVTPSAGQTLPPGLIVDSVDADDGTIDGIGNAGSFFFGAGSTGIAFTFDPAVLGGLPSHAGLVWTDGVNPITFEAFDENGASLGQLTGNHADGSFASTTAEDRFYGATNAGGISAIMIRNGGSGIEVDHLQYGLGGAISAPVPEPGTLALLGLAVLGLATAVRRRGDPGARCTVPAQSAWSTRPPPAASRHHCDGHRVRDRRPVDPAAAARPVAKWRGAHSGRAICTVPGCLIHQIPCINRQEQETRSCARSLRSALPHSRPLPPAARRRRWSLKSRSSTMEPEACRSPSTAMAQAI